MTTILRSFGLLALAVAVLTACQPNPAPQSDKDPIIGKYDWFVDGSSHRGTTHIAYEGYIIDIYESDNPRSAGARVAGFWKLLDKQKRQYLLHWKDPWNEFKDTLVLSEDGNYLKGTNDSGRVIEGKRVRPTKASSEVVGYYMETSDKENFVRWNFKSDGVVLRHHEERYGGVQLPAQWTLSGNVVTVAFHPSHAKSGLVPKEISFEVLPNGDMRGINEAKDALLTRQERKKESRHQSENAPSK